VCVSLGLKKPGDFTVSEGHRYPLVLYNESKHDILALVGKAPKNDKKAPWQTMISLVSLNGQIKMHYITSF
jgi:hypothetical protein